MESETRQCQNCKKDFMIEPDDFGFYEKIKVPPPTFCPECRFKARRIFRNQTNFYKRECDLCKKSMISMYAPEKPFPVYCRECFYGDGWDAMQYAKNFDFTKPFFEQYKNLLNVTPRIHLIGVNKVNSDYSNHVTEVKNVYLSFSVGNSENCYFVGPQCTGDKNCSSSSMIRDCEWCYMLVDCEKCYKVSFSQNSSSCLESTFLYNCSNCSDCLGCVNLRNKKYCILNKQYTQEDFLKEKSKLALNSLSGFVDFKFKFDELKNKSIRKYAMLENTQNCTGDNISRSKNCKESFVVVDSENVKYGYICNSAKDCMDVSNTYPASELSYYSMAPVQSNKIFFSCFVYSNCLDLWYSDNCYTTSNSFGCISLKNKEFCILNKQYSREQYFEMVEKIKKHMNDMPYFDKKDRVYKYGDFFPFDLSPFAYNESALQEYFPITKEEAIDQGFTWREEEKKFYNITLFYENLDQKNNYKKDESILNQIIECAHKDICTHNCTSAFRILPDELNIYNNLDAPIPILCPNCRHAERYALRNPLKLWRRQCMCDKKHNNHEGKCEVEFETSYAPERPEIIYCERCYQQEVY